MSNLIPTNLITGFLGVGKTTAIRHLLQHKPEAEVWSVLVNEFGEIGIDGALLKDTGAHVREVSGGCICCVAGLPMKVALNMLIATTKPDRILIEPTGLGHPEEIIGTLTGQYYDQVLDLRATLTLVDARKLADPRYADNITFRDQIAVADVLIANKSDLCTDADWQNLDRLLAESQPPKQGSQRVEQGALDLAWLDLVHDRRASTHPQHHRNNPLQPRTALANPMVEIPAGHEFVRKAGQGQGFYSCGWVFVPDLVFDFNGLFSLISGLPAARVKAVMITDQGVFSFSADNGVLSVNELDDTLDSRIELIDSSPIEAAPLEQELLGLGFRE